MKHLFTRNYFKDKDFSTYAQQAGISSDYLNGFFGKKAAKQGYGLSGADILSAYMTEQKERRMYEDYESIPAQMAQMEAAGLNTALMYGGSGSSAAMPMGGVESVQASEPNYEMDAFTKMASAVQTLFQIRGQQAQLEGLNLDNALKMQDIANRQADTQGKEIGNKYAAGTLDDRIEAAGLANDAVKATIRFTDMSVRKQDAEINQIKHYITNLDTDTCLKRFHCSKTEAETILIKTQTALANVDLEHRDAFLDSVIKLNKFQAALSDAHAKKLTAEIPEIEARIKLLLKDVELHNAEISKVISEVKLNNQAYWFNDEMNPLRLDIAGEQAMKARDFQESDNWFRALYQVMNVLGQLFSANIGHWE
ncbi:minor capsid protein [Capybara microvirus Cap1_SP_76]|nr:minor capsid protein [Capybara microvirus Cap1_SP_76]